MLSSTAATEQALQNDEVVADFVETCGGLGSMKNLAMIYKIIALIEAEKNEVQNQKKNQSNDQNLYYDDSRKSYVQGNSFYDGLRDSLIALDNRHSLISQQSAAVDSARLSAAIMMNEPSVVSGYLYLQLNANVLNNQEWTKFLIVLQKGIAKCYDNERRWQRSINLKGFKHKLTSETFIYLSPPPTQQASLGEIIFESRDNSVLKWTEGFISHIEFAESLTAEEAASEKDRDRNSLVSNPLNNANNSSAKSSPASSNTPEPAAATNNVLSQLRVYLIETITKSIEETNDEEYEYGLKTALAKLYQTEDDYIQAEKLYIECYDGRKRLLGDEHFFTISSMDNLVDLYVLTESYEKGVKMLAEALQIRKQKLGNENPVTLVCMNNLAFIYERLGRSIQSELLYRECCDIYVNIYGTDHPHSLLAMRNLANLFFKHGKFEFAEDVFRGCFEIQLEKSGIDHPETFTLLRNLVNVYLQLKASLTDVASNNSEAFIESKTIEYDAELNKLLQYMEECVFLREDKLGPADIATITAMNMVGFLSLKLNKQTEAEKYYIQVIKFRQDKLGMSHDDTLSAMSNLASLYFQQQQFTKAQPMFLSIVENIRKIRKNASEIENELKSSAFLTALSNAANAFYSQQNFTQAESLYEEMIKTVNDIEKKNNTNSNSNSSAITEEQRIQKEKEEKAQVYLSGNLEIDFRTAHIDGNHPCILTAYTNLANIYYRKKLFTQAELLYVKCLDVRKKILGDDHIDTLSSMKNLAVLYQTMQKPDLALPLYVSCLEGRRKVYGNDHADTLLAISYVGHIYNLKGLVDLAMPLYEEYIATWLMQGQPIDDVVSIVMNNLGIIYYKQKDFDKAQPLLEQVAEYKKTQLTIDNANTLFCYGNLGNVYRSAKKYDLAEQVYSTIYESKKKSMGESHAETVAAFTSLTAVRKALGKE